MTKKVRAGMLMTINDPGNARLAITVGATHSEKPHEFGPSYFSSKGPTGDGRLKPDLLAPGERIISCGAGSKTAGQGRPQDRDRLYIDASGTSMAAPHVSGAIAAFLSVRREFIGRPEQVKEIFVSSATDLGRDRNMQGSGVVDLMRAIQSV
jgi:subtilisin family serine protease